MSYSTAAELSQALRAALPQGFEPTSITVDCKQRLWQLTLSGTQTLSEAELKHYAAHLTGLTGNFRVTLCQDVQPLVAEVALDDPPPWEDASEREPEVIDEIQVVAPVLGDNLPPEDDILFDLFPADEPLDALLPQEEPAEPDPTEAVCRELENNEEQYRREREVREQEHRTALAQQLPRENGTSNEDEPLYGRPIRGKAIPLDSLDQASGKITVSGRVFLVETYVSRNTGSTTYRFDICDNTDSLTVKVLPGFERGRGNSGGYSGGNGNGSDRKSDRLGEIKKDQWITVYGSLNDDTRDGELQLLADSISSCAAPPEREDHGAEGRKRVELHAHTNMSSMDALPAAEDLVRLAARFGHEAIAITDHGVLQSFPEAMLAGKACGIKIIYGCEAYLIETGDDRQYYHITILVKNKEGLKALYELTTEAHLKYFYRRPRMLRTLLVKHRQHLLLGSACAAGEVYQALWEGYNDDFEAAIAKATERAQFYDYLEVMPLGHLEFLIQNEKVADRDGLIAINKAMIAIAQKLGKPVVATSDVHFLNPGDAIYREILQAGQDYEQSDAQCMLHLRTTDEMLAEFDYLDAELAEQVVIDNTQLVAAQIEAIKPIPDKLYPPSLEGADTLLRELAENTARVTYGDPLPDIVAQRLERELQCIIGYGYAVTYWIAHKLVQRSLSDGYLVGSRGSIGSSLAATFAGITEVNPLPAHYRCPSCLYSDFSPRAEYDCGVDLPDKLCPHCGEPLAKDGFNIAFETFMGFEGDKVPDIDLNFSGEYHAEAHRQCEELLGKENVFRAGTISTVADKTAFGFVMKYFDARSVTKRKAEVGRLAQGLVGVKRTTGQHPGGLMVVPADMSLHDFTPAQRPADDKDSGIITTHFDFHAIHDCLLKLDLLGHDDPTILRHLQDLTGIDVRSVPLSDEKVLSLFTKVDALGNPKDFTAKTGTLGVPEFGTNFVRGMLLEAKPGLFSDLVRISGLSHGTDVWANNARDLIVNNVSSLREVISTRDDIMAYLMVKGLPSKVAFRIMEAVRKGRSLTLEDEQVMREHEVPDWYITSCKRIKYLFPKAHAVAYVTSGVRIAWFKVYQPEAFYATYFGIRGSDGFDAALAAQGPKALQAAQQELAAKIKNNTATAKEQAQFAHIEVACEACVRGIRFLPVDLYRSHAYKYQILPEGLLPPLSGLLGLGLNAAQSIVEARTVGDFTSIEDLRLRSKINKSVIEVLQNAGCLEGMTETDQLTLF